VEGEVELVPRERRAQLGSRRSVARNDIRP